MRAQYHFRESKKGKLLVWDVRNLIQAAQGLTVRWIDVLSIKELKESYWYDLGGQKPTCMNVIDHIRLIQSVNFHYPIILCQDGGIMDGMHRVCKAYIEGKKKIEAVQFNLTPHPDFIDIAPDDLAYS